MIELDRRSFFKGAAIGVSALAGDALIGGAEARAETTEEKHLRLARGLAGYNATIMYSISEDRKEWDKVDPYIHAESQFPPDPKQLSSIATRLADKTIEHSNSLRDVIRKVERVLTGMSDAEKDSTSESFQILMGTKTMADQMLDTLGVWKKHLEKAIINDW